MVQQGAILPAGCGLRVLDRARAFPYDSESVFMSDSTAELEFRRETDEEADWSPYVARGHPASNQSVPADAGTKGGSRPMLRFRFIMMSLVAVLTVGAIASAQASAHAFVGRPCRTGTDPNSRKWSDSVKCFDQTPIGGDPGGTWEHQVIAFAKVEGTSGVSKLESSIAKESVTIECAKDIATGTVETNGLSTGEVNIKECKIINKGKELATCKVKEPIVFKFKDQLIANGSGEVEDELKPTKAEEVFAEITIEGSLCVLKGTFKVKGVQTCELPHGEEFLITHEIACKPSGSKLKLGSEEAKFTGTERVNLSPAEEWSIE